MNKGYPLVSVIIPTFQRGFLLEETVNGVLNQSYTNWECLIIDDGSTDITEEIVSRLEKKDKRIKYFKRPDNYPKGAPACRNYGFTRSKGKYIQWLDDDDLLSANKLEKQVEVLENNNPLIFTTCAWDHYWEGKKIIPRSIFKEDEEISPDQYFNKLTDHQTFFPLHSFLTSRILILAAGAWNNDLTINQDGEFFTRINLKSQKLLLTKECYVLYRIHAGGRTSENIDSKNLRSLLYSFCLINDHLKFYAIENRKYFRWKLLKVLLKFGRTDSDIIKFHRNFFTENDIKISLLPYYQIKYQVYKLIKPLYKKYLK